MIIRNVSKLQVLGHPKIIEWSLNHGWMKHMLCLNL